MRKCEACHSDHPVQLLRLYARMRGKELRERGFLNATIVNESYVIGATRNRALDAVALLTMGATTGGIALHGGVRLLFALARRRRDGGSRETR